METEKDKELWRLAKKRVNFRSHLATYLIVNIFFWCLWWFDGNKNEEEDFPWPAWTSLGWGIGVAFDFVSAYFPGKPYSVQKEFEKLKGQNN